MTLRGNTSLSQSETFPASFGEPESLSSRRGARTCDPAAAALAAATGATESESRVRGIRRGGSESMQCHKLPVSCRCNYHKVYPALPLLPGLHGPLAGFRPRSGGQSLSLPGPCGLRPQAGGRRGSSP